MLKSHPLLVVLRIDKCHNKERALQVKLMFRNKGVVKVGVNLQHINTRTSEVVSVSTKRVELEMNLDYLVYLLYLVVIDFLRT